MQHLGQLLGIPGFEALMAESLEALGEPGMVERLLRRLGGALGSHKVVLFCPLPGSDDPLAAYQWGMPDDFLARYANLIQGCDAWSEALERQQGQALARGGSLSQQLVSTPALRRGAFYADYLRPLGIDAMVNSIVEASPEVGMHVLAMYNDLGQSELTPEQFARLRAATPWVRSLMRAQRRLQQAQSHTSALERTLDSGADQELMFRLCHSSRGFIWTRARLRRLCGEGREAPVIAEFQNASDEADTFANLLNESQRIIYVVDAATFELYYANRAALDYWHRDKLEGGTCFLQMRGLKEPCPWCVLRRMTSCRLHEEAHYDPGLNAYLQIDAQYVRWFGRDGVAIFVNDVTERHMNTISIENANSEMTRIISRWPGAIAEKASS